MHSSWSLWVIIPDCYRLCGINNLHFWRLRTQSWVLMRLSFWPTEDTDSSPCVAMGLWLAVCFRKGVVLVFLYKDRDHDVPKLHLYVISYRGVGLPSRSSEVTQQSTAPSLWEQRPPQEACPQHPHRHAGQTTDWLSHLHGPLGIQLWRARKLKLVRWENSRCHADIGRHALLPPATSFLRHPGPARLKFQPA